MSNLADIVQTVSIRALGSDPQVRLAKYRPALAALRACYARGDAPDFSDEATRGAYLLAYHPHHCVLAAEAFRAVGDDLLRISGKRSLRVTLLGAGPAPELAGLTWLLRDREDLSIDVHLIDREQGWSATRRVSIDQTLPEWWSGDLNVHPHWVDLASTTGLAEITPLLRESDIIVAQGLVTELANPTADGQLVDHIVNSFGADTRLLIIDFDQVPRFNRVAERVSHVTGAISLAEANFDVPAARPLPILADRLFSDSDGLRPRRSLHCGLRLLARPGTPSLLAPSALIPTPSQRDALEAFRKFLASDNRVFVLRGAAGTGKTTLFPHLIRAAAEVTLPAVLLAPTGQAARRLNGRAGLPCSTLHSHLYRFAETTSADDATLPVTRFAQRFPAGESAVYLVDESSLIGDVPHTEAEKVGAEVLFGEGRLLSDLLNNALAATDSRVILVGDPNQLPPVGERASPALCDEHLAVVTGALPVTADLTEVMRQQDGSAILDLANDWLSAGATPMSCENDSAAGIVIMPDSQLEAWLHEDVLSGNATVVAARNMDVQRWNSSIRTAAGRTSDGPVCGDRLLVLRTDLLTGLANGDEVEVVSASTETTLVRLGDVNVVLRKVELLRNTPAGGVIIETLLVDSLLAGATSAEQKDVTQALNVDFKFRTGLSTGTRAFDEQHARDERVHALRATYSYARTCHRAQGGEWENVIVDLAGVQAFGSDQGKWAYTALTRARRAVYLANVRVPFTPERLLAGARAAIEPNGLRIVVSRPIDFGIQITIDDPNTTTVPAKINLFSQKGLPSQAVATGPHHKSHADYVKLLNCWIESERETALATIPARIGHLVERLALDLSASGYDFEWKRRAEYQVEFTLISRDGRASITYNYKAVNHGMLGTERSTAGSGNLNLFTTLRAAVGVARD